MRNGLSLGLGTVASLTNGPGFLPDELFYGGTVQGAWYDPSDLTTLFQDAAGTTPVTAVEQAVGLMLDKSKGLVLGSELSPNVGPYANTSDWTAQNSASLAAVSGEIQITAGDGFSLAYIVIPVTAGKWYETTATARRGTATSAFFGVSNGNSGAPIVDGFGVASLAIAATSTTRKIKFLAPAGCTNARVLVVHNAQSVGATLFASSVSTRELPGNHAYQSINTSRPTLRARYNLLTYSEDFSAWTAFAASITTNTNQTLDPIGTNTADIFYVSTTGSECYVRQNVSQSANTTYVLSVYAKAKTGTWLRLRNLAVNNNSNSEAWFDLQNGVVGTVLAAVTASITSVGNGWYRCSISGTTGGSPLGLIDVALSSSDNTRATTLGLDAYFWGAQLVPTAVFPSNTYQRIGAATDYATGAAFPPYLFFDGTDDSMLTNSVDFTGTDKMLVVAGVTKSSDAAGGRVAELSADGETNNGAFGLWAPSTATTASLAYVSRGTTTRYVEYTNAGVAAPVTSVLTGQSNIGAPSASLRVNGAQAAASVLTQGTGNFGNYPLYIGRRNNATLPFNGNLYSLIIAGQSYSSGQISSTESWVAAKTPLGTI